MPSIHTFIVEDSPIILTNLVATLEELAPVKVVGSAPDEGTALRWLGTPENRCDLVIIDVVLKSGSGLGVLKGSTRSGLTARRVVLTNYATPDMRRRCAELGADRVFDKSGELEELIAYCSEMGAEMGAGSNPVTGSGSGAGPQMNSDLGRASDGDGQVTG